MPMKGDIFIKQISLEINGGCNLACEMCPQATGREKSFLKKLPMSLFKKVVDDGMQYGLEAVSLHGSGEPTLNNDMADYVKYVKDKGLQCHTLTNGYKLTPELGAKLLDAGIDYIRISAIGYDRDSYKKWMSRDAFEEVRENVRLLSEMNRARNGSAEIGLYHAVTDPARKDWEIDQYRRNWVDVTGVYAEIWMMHNWAGLYTEIPYVRDPREIRSCGRPSSPFLYVRAGGIDGHQAAVVPCCFVLGQDSKAVLGHLDTQTIREVVDGDKFDTLRLRHKQNNYDDLPYCKNCDQLYDAPESLVWTNVPGKRYGQPKAHRQDDFRAFA